MSLCFFLYARESKRMDVSFRSFLCAKENGQDFASFSTLKKVRKLKEKISFERETEIASPLYKAILPARTFLKYANKRFTSIMNMATISLEKSLLNEMSHIMGNEDLMTQTIKFVRSIRRKAKAEKAEWEYVPNAETRAAIEECESGKELETLDIANFNA